MKSGEDYRNLKNVIVIMITSYDPFGEDQMIYTVRNMCEELPDMPYDDGSKTLYLYTKGMKGNPSKPLRQLLKYMEHTTEENAATAELQAIQKMVRDVKQEKGVSLAYMKIFEREAMLIEQGRREEREKTLAEKARADAEKAQANRLEMELQQLKKLLSENHN